MKSLALPIGTLAPDFQLAGPGEQAISLSAYRGTKVVLVFYRGHWCPNCSHYLDLVHERHAELREAGAEVLAISADPAARTVTTFPFLTLADPDLVVIGQYGVIHDGEPEGRRIARPAVFVIDQAGAIRFSYVGEDAQDRPALGLILLALESLA